MFGVDIIYEQVPKGEHPVNGKKKRKICCDLKKKRKEKPVKMKRRLCTKRNLNRKIVPLHVFYFLNASFNPLGPRPPALFP